MLAPFATMPGTKGLAADQATSRGARHVKARRIAVNIAWLPALLRHGE
jgi:hypothetical protein